MKTLLTKISEIKDRRVIFTRKNGERFQALIVVQNGGDFYVLPNNAHRWQDAEASNDKEIMSELANEIDETEIIDVEEYKSKTE